MFKQDKPQSRLARLWLGIAFAPWGVDVCHDDSLSMSVNAASKELGTTAALLRSRERLRSAVRRAAIGVSAFRRNRDRLRFAARRA